LGLQSIKEKTFSVGKVAIIQYKLRTLHRPTSKYGTYMENRGINKIRRPSIQMFLMAQYSTNVRVYAALCVTIIEDAPCPGH
jgi:hypothetical protein